MVVLKVNQPYIYINKLKVIVLNVAVLICLNIMYQK